MDIMSMALRIQALEAENARLHETIRDMWNFGAAFPNTMSVLKTVGFVKFLDPQTIVNLSQAHRAFKDNLPVGHVNMERSRLALDRARDANIQLGYTVNSVNYQRDAAYKLLAHLWRSDSVQEHYLSEVVRFFADFRITNQAVERFADDGLGPMPHEMLSDSEEEDDSEGEDDEQF